MLTAGPAGTAKADSPQDTGRQPLAVEAPAGQPTDGDLVDGAEWVVGPHYGQVRI